MNRKCAFTICTKNYKGLAETLKNSFLTYNKDFDFFISYIDETKFDNANDEELIIKEIIQKYITEEKYYEMAFKYNLTEFCTSVKPFLLKYFLEQNYELAVYFDPDLIFFSRFNELLNDKYIVYVTPHLLTQQGAEYEGNQNDNSSLAYGIFNCGFIAFRNTIKAISILDWWAYKLSNLAYDDPKFGYYTDQKWMDFLPIYLKENELCIIRNPGCNIAPWNFFERKIIRNNNDYIVTSRNNKFEGEYKLCFLHASGYNYIELCNGTVKHNSRDLLEIPDIDKVLLEYGEELKKNKAVSYFNIPYCYGTFSDGSNIITLHRRMYRRALENGLHIQNLFSEDGRYYKFLKKNGLIFNNAPKIPSVNQIHGYGRKYRIFIRFLELCRKILGGRRYIEFMSGLKKYSQDEEIAMYIGGNKGIMELLDN